MSKGERITNHDWFLLSEEFLDHLGALSVDEPGLDTPQAKFVLDGAAQAAAGAVAYATYFPDHYFSVSLDYVNFGMSYDAGSEGSPASVGAFEWLDAFCLAVLTDTTKRHGEAFDHARRPAQEGQAGLPTTELINGFMAYVLGDTGGDAANRPPSEEDKLAAIDGALTRIRTIGDELGRDLGQQPETTALLALRALAAGEREAFGAALTKLLLTCKEIAGSRVAPRHLLPLAPLALAALAYRREGWQAPVDTDYLPRALVTGFEAQSPETGRPGGLSRAGMLAELRSGAGIFGRPEE